VRLAEAYDIATAKLHTSPSAEERSAGTADTPSDTESLDAAPLGPTQVISVAGALCFKSMVAGNAITNRIHPKARRLCCSGNDCVARLDVLACLPAGWVGVHPRMMLDACL
jgi:hypothetical protein